MGNKNCHLRRSISPPDNKRTDLYFKGTYFKGNIRYQIPITRSNSGTLIFHRRKRSAQRRARLYGGGRYVGISYCSNLHSDGSTISVDSVDEDTTILGSRGQPCRPTNIGGLSRFIQTARKSAEVLCPLDDQILILRNGHHFRYLLDEPLLYFGGVGRQVVQCGYIGIQRLNESRT